MLIIPASFPCPDQLQKTKPPTQTLFVLVTKWSGWRMRDEHRWRGLVWTCHLQDWAPLSIYIDLRRQNTRHKNPPLVVQHCFVARFWSTCRATKTFVAGWRKLLRKVERGSTLSNKFWLFCSLFIKLTTCRATNLLVPYKSTNQHVAFLQPATNVFVAGQVDQARWKTPNIDQNLQRNNVARQVEGFCSSYFASFTTSRATLFMGTLLITCTAWVVKCAVKDVMTSVHLAFFASTLMAWRILLIVGHVQNFHAGSVLVVTSSYLTTWRGRLGQHYKAKNRINNWRVKEITA